MSYYIELASTLNYNIKAVRKDLELFFANSLFGFCNWKYKVDFNGNSIIVSTDGDYLGSTKYFDLFNRNNAISAIKAVGTEYNIDLTKECEYIENLNPIRLRGELVAVLYSVKSKVSK